MPLSKQGVPQSSLTLQHHWKLRCFKTRLLTVQQKLNIRVSQRARAKHRDTLGRLNDQIDDLWSQFDDIAIQMQNYLLTHKSGEQNEQT